MKGNLIDSTADRRNSAGMELSQRLNKLASDFSLRGGADAQLAIAACVLLDRNNEVAVDGRDLPGTTSRLIASLSAPQKVAVLAALVAGIPTVDPAVVGQLWSNAGVLTISAG